MTKTTIKQWPIPNSNPSQDMTQYPPYFLLDCTIQRILSVLNLEGKPKAENSGKTRKAVTVKGSEAEQKKRKRKKPIPDKANVFVQRIVRTNERSVDPLISIIICQTL